MSTSQLLLKKTTGHNIRWNHLEILSSGKSYVHCICKPLLVSWSKSNWRFLNFKSYHNNSLIKRLKLELENKINKTLHVKSFFVKTNVMKFEKMSRGKFSGPDKLENHTNEGKGRAKKKERGGRWEKKNYIGYFREIVFGRKKTVGQKRAIWQ